MQQKLFPRFGSFNDGFLLLSFMCPFSISYTWSAPFSRVRTNAKWLKFYFRLFFTSLFSRHMSLHVISVNDHLHDNFDVSLSLHPNRWEFFKICTTENMFCLLFCWLLLTFDILFFVLSWRLVRTNKILVFSSINALFIFKTTLSDQLKFPALWKYDLLGRISFFCCLQFWLVLTWSSIPC